MIGKKKQMEIIMPLGGMAWEILSKYYGLEDKGKTITEVIKGLPEERFYKIGDTFLIPNFHPASHVDPKIIDRQFRKFWEIAMKEIIV